jgi:group I intron endonuclease
VSFGRIYLVTNKFNDKKYVGQTVTKHSRHGHGHAIKDAYKKYGHSNFDYIPLIEGQMTSNQLDCFEKFWINVFDCLAPNGYNLEGGGRRGKYAYHSPNLGKKLSPETRLKMSISQKKYWNSLDVHPSIGMKHTAETKAKMSRAHKGRVQSVEERLKRSESIRAWHAERKNEHK